jgi:hypothetical protein
MTKPILCKFFSPPSVRDGAQKNGDWFDLLAGFFVMRYIRICI